MTLLESYFQTIDNYAEQAKQKVGLADKDELNIQIDEINKKCENTKYAIKNLYEAMKEEINKSDKTNPIRNEILERLESLKKSLNIEDGITFARYSEDEER